MGRLRNLLIGGLVLASSACGGLKPSALAENLPTYAQEISAKFCERIKAVFKDNNDVKQVQLNKGLCEMALEDQTVLPGVRGQVSAQIREYVAATGDQCELITGPDALGIGCFKSEEPNKCNPGDVGFMQNPNREHFTTLARCS